MFCEDNVDAKGQCRPIAYASRTLSKAETGYSQIEKEVLALVFGVKRFHYYLYGRTFVLVTDHKPLHTILGPKTGIPTIAAARLQRWAVLLSAYTYTLKFKSSAENADSNCLSRLPLPDHSEEPSEEMFYVFRFSTLPVNCRDVARETCRDPVLKNVLHYVLSGWPDRAPSDELKPFSTDGATCLSSRDASSLLPVWSFPSDTSPSCSENFIKNPLA